VRLLARLALLVLGLVVATLPAAAQSPPAKLALIIAVGDYEGEDWPKLKNPTADARLLRDTLEAAGFRLSRPAVNLRREQLIERLDEFQREAAKLPPNSIALIYFSGHGIQIDGMNYVVPLGTRALDRVYRLQGEERERVLASEFLSLNALLDSFGRNRRLDKSMANVLILDACRVNPLEGRTRSAGLPKGLADVSRVSNTLIAMAAAPGTYAYDGSGANSPYAQALAAELKQVSLPLELLFTRVRARTMALTNDRQEPEYRASLSNFFCLNGCNADGLASLPALPSPVSSSSGPIMLERSARRPSDCDFCPALTELALGGKKVSLSRFPVSVGQWRKCVDEAGCPPLTFQAADDMPATKVSWAAALGYVQWLSGRTGKRWRLVSEEEWRLAFAPFASQTRRKVRRLPSLVAASGESGLGYVGRILEWTDGCRKDCQERVAMGATFDDDFSGLISSYGFAPENSGEALGFRVVREN
jgi:hypothetical protein